MFMAEELIEAMCCGDNERTRAHVADYLYALTQGKSPLLWNVTVQQNEKHNQELPDYFYDGYMIDPSKKLNVGSEPRRRLARPKQKKLGAKSIKPQSSLSNSEEWVILDVVVVAPTNLERTRSSIASFHLLFFNDNTKPSTSISLSLMSP